MSNETIEKIYGWLKANTGKDNKASAYKISKHSMIPHSTVIRNMGLVVGMKGIRCKSVGGVKYYYYEDDEPCRDKT